MVCVGDGSLSHCLRVREECRSECLRPSATSERTGSVRRPSKDVPGGVLESDRNRHEWKIDGRTPFSAVDVAVCWRGCSGGEDLDLGRT